MGRGRKPLPSHLKLIRGTTRADRRNGAEPKLERARPPAPEHLSDRARAAWQQVSALLDRMGVLTQADALALELLCEAWADLLSAREELVRSGETYTTATGSVRAHPSVAIRNDASRRVQSLLAEFGMTPSSRSKVISKGLDEEDDPATAYFG